MWIVTDGYAINLSKAGIISIRTLSLDEEGFIYGSCVDCNGNAYEVTIDGIAIATVSLRVVAEELIIKLLKYDRPGENFIVDSLNINQAIFDIEKYYRCQKNGHVCGHIVSNDCSNDYVFEGCRDYDNKDGYFGWCKYCGNSG